MPRTGSARSDTTFLPCLLTISGCRIIFVRKHVKIVIQVSYYHGQRAVRNDQHVHIRRLLGLVLNECRRVEVRGLPVLALVRQVCYIIKTSRTLLPAAFRTQPSLWGWNHRCSCSFWPSPGGTSPCALGTFRGGALTASSPGLYRQRSFCIKED